MNTEQYCIVSRNVAENGFEINHFWHTEVGIYEQPSTWVFMRGDEDDGFATNGDKVCILSLEEVIFIRPFVRKFLDAPIGSRFYYDETYDRVEDCTEKKTLSMDRRVAAPNAAEIRLQPLTYLRHFPGDAVPWLICLFFVVPAILHHPAWLILSVIFLTRGVVNWAHLHEHFKFGRLVPGIVIKDRPLLLAVELQYWDGINNEFARFVKVLNLKKSTADGRARTGDLFATATLVAKQTWYDKKFDMYPLPLNYAINRPEILESKLDSFHPAERDSLREAVAQLGPQPRSGLYRIQPLDKEDLISNEFGLVA